MSSKRSISLEDGTAVDSPSNKTPKKSVTKLNILQHQANINGKYLQKNHKQIITDAFQDHKHCEIAEIVVHSEPFTCVQLPHFIQDGKFLEGLKDELLDSIFYEKSNDLYKFQQSDDLKKCSSPHVKELRKLLYGDFLSWLRDVTGIALNDTVDMTCAKYEYTDVLLCHDDELEGRRIAFILYLVPHWDIKDGGNLDLFETDEHGQPSEIVKSLVPSWNTLSFFEVTPVSFHQVSEVLTQDKTRLSVSGWFHGPPIDRPAPFIEPLHVLQPAVTFQNDKLGDWLNPMYIDMLIQSQIQEKFSEDSEIELQNFLKEEKYEAVLSAVKESAIKWVRKGPANKRNYEMASDTSLPGILKECIEVLKSEEMFLLLSNFTGLRLHELAPDSDSEDDMRGDDSESVKAKEETKKKEINPRCRSEVRRWRHGSYTLLHDTDTEGAEYALDCMLFLNCNGWENDYGGYVSYLAKGEDEELLSVNPADNSLALVYRDKETLRFVKHINQKISSIAEKDMETAGFYDITLVYYE